MFNNLYMEQSALLALNSGAFVARVQILLRRSARCLIRAQPVFERIRCCGLIANFEP